MKMSTLTVFGTALSLLLISGANAQQLTQPLSVRPIGFNYNNYQDAEAASPSDVVPDAPAAEAAAESVGSGATDSGMAMSSSCCGGCDSGCGCDTGCGCDGGCGDRKCCTDCAILSVSGRLIRCLITAPCWLRCILRSRRAAVG